jgi:hypothetical protein
MVYLVKYKNNLYELSMGTGDPKDIEKWTVVEEICEYPTLLKINPFLNKKGLPIIDDLSNFKYKGMTLVYFTDGKNQLYIIDSDHKDYMGIIRDYKLKNILE